MKLTRKEKDRLISLCSHEIDFDMSEIEQNNGIVDCKGYNDDIRALEG